MIFNFLFSEITTVIIEVIFDIVPIAIAIPTLFARYFKSPFSILRSLQIFHEPSVTVTLRLGLTKYFHSDLSGILMKHVRHKSFLSSGVFTKRIEIELLRILSQLSQIRKSSG